MPVRFGFRRAGILVMAGWRDTPEGERVLAERLDGERVRFSQLRVGDVVRFVGPTGKYVESSLDGWSDCDDIPKPVRIVEGPELADGTKCPQDFGWCLLIVEEENLGKVLN